MQRLRTEYEEFSQLSRFDWLESKSRPSKKPLC